MQTSPFLSLALQLAGENVTGLVFDNAVIGFIVVGSIGSNR